MSVRARALALARAQATFSVGPRDTERTAGVRLPGGESPDSHVHDCMHAVGHTVGSSSEDRDGDLPNPNPNPDPKLSNLNTAPSTLTEAKGSAAAAQTARGDADTSQRLRAETRAVRGMLSPEEVRQIRDKSRDCIAKELQRWRDSFTVQDAKAACKTRAASYSLGVFCSGGCLDTFAGIRSGLLPLWGTETDAQRGQMFVDLTQAPCLGDTFEVDFSLQPKVDVLWSGQPCPDWSSSHQGRRPPGDRGETGWQFVAQTDKILEVRPHAFVIEMVPNALRVNNGAAVSAVLKSLGGHYTQYIDVVQVAAAGDASARERLLIVGFRKETVGAHADGFVFSPPLYDSRCFHTARDIAVPDAEVPAAYWRYDRPPLLPRTVPVPLRMHKLARSGVGMGFSELPCLVQSWEGLVNTQTCHNGGGRRPALSWRPGDPLTRTRLTVPVETVRIASLPADYQTWCYSFNSGDKIDDDRHLRECVNMGVPVRTACSVNEAIQAVLVAAGIPRATSGSDSRAQAANLLMESSALLVEHAGSSPVHGDGKVRRIQVDTGASSTFVFMDAEPFMQDRQPSNISIRVASDDVVLRGSSRGTIKAHVVNMAAGGLPDVADFGMPATSVPGLTKELLSLDDFYRRGRYSLLLRQPDYEDGVCELYRAPKPGVPEARIPLAYDWHGGGGWHMFYIPAHSVDAADMMLCSETMIDECQDRGPRQVRRLELSVMSEPEACAMHAALVGTDAVREVIDSTSGGDGGGLRHAEGALNDVDDAWLQEQVRSAQKLHCVQCRHVGEREILGTKAGLKRQFKQMSRKDFHEKFSHMGACPGCRVCEMSRGVMRRIFTKVDPYRETRVGFAWAMDGITFSHRSDQGCKYLCVMRDIATGAFHFIPLFRKSDIVQAFSDWVTSMRRNALYSNLPYPVVSVVRTDNEGTWSVKARRWLDMLAELDPSVEMVYVSPDRHAQENGYAEAACKAVELHIKCALFAANLPPSWWQYCAADVLFLLNRFPAASDDVALPIDGDRQSPLEALTRGFYSRRQIQRELSYFVSCGTPALVHDPAVAGSHLGPKTRWGVACGMYREQVHWLCPFTKARFRSKSYKAYRLQEGMNYGHLLRVPIKPSARAGMELQEDYVTPAELVVQLPEVRDLAVGAPTVLIDETARVNAKYKAAGVQRLSAPRVTNAAGRVMKTDPATGELYYDDVANPSGAPVIVDETVSVQRDAGPLSDEDDDSDDDRDGDGAGAESWPQGQFAPRRSSRVPVAPLPESPVSAPPVQPAPAVQVPVHDPVPRDPASASLPAVPKRNKQRPKMGPKSKRRHVEKPEDFPAEYVADVDLQVEDMQMDDLERHFETVPGRAEQQEKDDWEMSSNWENAVVAGPLCPLKTLLKRQVLKAAVPYELHEVYREWLITVYEYDPLDIPWRTSTKGKPTQKQCVKVGTKLPVPGGRAWDRMVTAARSASKAGRRASEDECDRVMHECASLAFVEQVHLLRAFKAEMKAGALPSKGNPRHQQMREKAVAVGQRPPPMTLGQAFRGPQQSEWVESAQSEFDGLSDNKVVEHDFTLDQLRDAGVPVHAKTGRVRPIPLSVVLDHKYTDGVLSRYKTRMALAGHSGNMQKGVHFDKTFAASPNSNSSRLLQALMVYRRWKRLSFDIKQAYIHADLPPGHLIAVRYPDGFKRFDSQGNELYMLLRKNLYGHPAASRAWSQTRDRYLLEKFNPADGSWTCSRCTMDPCLFKFTKRCGDKTLEAVALIYTDDCDIIGESDEMMREIFDIVDAKWGAKVVDAAFVLGVKRELSEDPVTKAMVVEMTMEAFIDGMVSAFANHLPVEDVDTPFPDGLKLSRLPHTLGKVPKEETAAVLDRGYMRAVGMLLWAARNVFADCTAGVSQLCRVMSCPDEQAWSAAMHMIAWLRAQKTRGIKFTSPHTSISASTPCASTLIPGASTSIPGASTPIHGASTLFPCASTPRHSASTLLPGASTPCSGASTHIPGASTPIPVKAPRYTLPETVAGADEPFADFGMPSFDGHVPLSVSVQPIPDTKAVPRASWPRGIPSTGPGTPVAFSDASNDSDPMDGLAQFGFVVMMCSGPVIFNSKKLKHKSPTGSASHCEYMAMCFCNQAVVWLRQLLVELGFDELVKEPTIVYGDNRQANTLCSEDIVTTGNQYIYLPYHWNKEVVSLGYVQIRDCRTALNLADLFTKPVPSGKIRDLMLPLLGYELVQFSEIDKGFTKDKAAT